jgi:hypothetical protein
VVKLRGETGSNMRVLRFLSVLLLASVVAIGPLLAQQKLSANDAKDHVGARRATVCGSVVSTPLRTGDQGTADLSQSRQAVPESGVHSADLGREPQQVWDAGERVQGER